MAKRKTKRYTNNGSQKIHIKLKIEQYETTKTGGNAGAPEELALPVLLVTYINYLQEINFQLNPMKNIS
jgi:hypothetical protein